MKTKEERLLGNIKAVFLCALVILVFANTMVLAVLFPIVGYHLMPDSQATAEAWKVVREVMIGCMCVILMSIIGYGTVKVINWRTETND